MSETILSPPPTARTCLNIRVSLAEAVTSWFTQLPSVTNAMETLNPNTFETRETRQTGFWRVLGIQRKLEPGQTPTPGITRSAD